MKITCPLIKYAKKNPNADIYCFKQGEGFENKYAH